MGPEGGGVVTIRKKRRNRSGDGKRFWGGRSRGVRRVTPTEWGREQFCCSKVNSSSYEKCLYFCHPGRPGVTLVILFPGTLGKSKKESLKTPFDNSATSGIDPSV